MIANPSRAHQTLVRLPPFIINHSVATVINERVARQRRTPADRRPSHVSMTRSARSRSARNSTAAQGVARKRRCSGTRSASSRPRVGRVRGLESAPDQLAQHRPKQLRPCERAKRRCVVWTEVWTNVRIVSPRLNPPAPPLHMGFGSGLGVRACNGGGGGAAAVWVRSVGLCARWVWESVVCEVGLGISVKVKERAGSGRSGGAGVMGAAGVLRGRW